MYVWLLITANYKQVISLEFGFEKGRCESLCAGVLLFLTVMLLTRQK